MDLDQGPGKGAELIMIKKPDTQRGAILLMVVFLIFLIAILMIYLSLLHRKDLEIVTNQMEDLQALYCADAGIQRAIYDIRKTAAQPNWPGGGRSVNLDPYGGAQDCVTNIPAGPDAPGYDSLGTYSVRITENKANDDANKEVPGAVYRYVMITSTARLNPPSNHQRSITALVRRSAIWTMFPFPNLTYYTEIRQYQEN